MKTLLTTSIALAIAFGLTACSHNPNKAEKIDTAMDKADHVSGDTEVGVKEGNMVVQRKTLMSEELRDLQYEVYGLEDQVYGNAKYKSMGLYGNLKDCKLQLTDKSNGGDGKLLWTEPMDRVTDKEENLKMGVDEKDKVVGVSEEFLRDRLTRFRDYKKLLLKRQEEYEEKLQICKTELKARRFDKEKAKDKTAEL